MKVTGVFLQKYTLTKVIWVVIVLLTAFIELRSSRGLLNFCTLCGAAVHLHHDHLIPLCLLRVLLEANLVNALHHVLEAAAHLPDNLPATRNQL